MITKSEVRALVLARLGPRLGDVVWDVGAGSGSVAVECARLRRRRRRRRARPRRRARARATPRAHGVDVQVVQGTAPAALDGLPDPDAVFVGGGGADVAVVVRACVARRPARRRRRPRHRRPGRARCRDALGPVRGRRRAAARQRRLRPLGAGHRPGRHQPRLPARGGTREARPRHHHRRRRAPPRPGSPRPGDTPHVRRPRASPTPGASATRSSASSPPAPSCGCVAPLLQGKAVDPGVVCVDEAQRFAVALLGGHGGGANELADRVADVLGAQPVVTTATDAVGLPGLDTLGWPVEGAVAAVSRAMLDGEPVRLEADAHLAAAAAAPRRATRRRARPRASPTGSSASTRSPPCCARRRWCSGIGSSRGVSADELEALVDRALADAGAVGRVGRARSAPPTPRPTRRACSRLCARRGWPLTTYASERARRRRRAQPERAARRPRSAPRASPRPRPCCSATSSSCEKTKSAMGTVAVARRRPRGRLAARRARPRRARPAHARARRPSCAARRCGSASTSTSTRSATSPGPARGCSSPGSARRRSAPTAPSREAAAGHAVALLGSGDAGVYAMASPGARGRRHRHRRGRRARA